MYAELKENIVWPHHRYAVNSFVNYQNNNSRKVKSLGRCFQTLVFIWCFYPQKLHGELCYFDSVTPTAMNAHQHT